MIKLKNTATVILLLAVSLTANNIKIISKDKLSDGNINLTIKAKTIDVNTTKLSQQNSIVNTTIVTYPNQDIKTATVFLIDTSVPMKKAVVGGIKPMLSNLYNIKSEFDEYCVTQFDADLKVIRDFNNTDIGNSLGTIKIKGQRTELFRASLEAMKLLKPKDGYIKYLVILSDGEAEDISYTIDDILKVAKKENITIISLGYRDSVNMQSIRRIAEETRENFL